MTADNRTNARIKISAVDLFCGAGGLTHGFVRKGVTVRAGFDVDPFCRFPYEQNNGALFVQKSVSDATGQEISGYYEEGEIKTLAGCAPCQPFSTYAQGARGARNNKWSMLREFARLTKELQPDIVTMENVPKLMRHSVFNEFVETLKECGFYIDAQIAYCPDFGIPQTRSRLVLLASRFGEIALDKPEQRDVRHRTVREAIGDQPEVGHGQSLIADRLHTASRLSELNLLRIRASKPGGTWQDWEEELLAECHRKLNGRSYKSVYGRMEWDKPSPTITTQFIGYGNGRFGHPEQDRALTLREGSIIQTFPENYAFVPPGEIVYFKPVARMIGNAVPVKLGEAIAESIVKHITQHQ